MLVLEDYPSTFPWSCSSCSGAAAAAEPRLGGGEGAAGGGAGGSGAARRRGARRRHRRTRDGRLGRVRELAALAQGWRGRQAYTSALASLHSPAARPCVPVQRPLRAGPPLLCSGLKDPAAATRNAALSSLLSAARPCCMHKCITHPGRVETTLFPYMQVLCVYIDLYYSFVIFFLAM